MILIIKLCLNISYYLPLCCNSYKRSSIFSIVSFISCTSSWVSIIVWRLVDYISDATQFDGTIRVCVHTYTYIKMFGYLQVNTHWRVLLGPKRSVRNWCHHFWMPSCQNWDLTGTFLEWCSMEQRSMGAFRWPFASLQQHFYKNCRLKF